MDKILIDGGLDLVHARPATLPGHVRECLNYEVGWSRGLSRIDGFERFDGTLSPSTTTGWIFEYPKDPDNPNEFIVGEQLAWANTDANDTGAAGFCVDFHAEPDHYVMAIAFREGGLRPPNGGSIYTTGDNSSGGYLEVDDIIPGTLKTFTKGLGTTHQDYIHKLGIFADQLRSKVRPVPGGSTIVGLHFHEDQLYAIRDAVEASVPADKITTLVPGMYVFNEAGLLGEVIKVDIGENRVDIAAVTSAGFTLAAGEQLTTALTVRFIEGTGELVAGELAKNTSGTWRGKLEYISIRDGATDSSNASGTAVFSVLPVATEDVADDTLITLANAATMKVEKVLFQLGVGITEKLPAVGEVFPLSSFATLWRSTPEGWEAATTSRTMTFQNGEVDPLSTDPVDNVSVSDCHNAFRATSVSYDSDWDTSPEPPGGQDPNNLHAIEGAPDGSFIYSGVHSPHPGVMIHTDHVTALDYKVALEDDDVVTGIEVLLTCRNSTLTGNTYIGIRMAGGQSKSILVPRQHDFATVPLGGKNDTWGRVLTPAIVNAANFGFTFYAGPSSVSAAHPAVDSVQIKVYFTRLPGSKLYLWDDTQSKDVGYIKVAATVLQDGVWGGTPAVTTPPESVADAVPKASGYFRITDWSVVQMVSGLKMYTKPGGAAGNGVLIGETGGSVSIPALPGSRLLRKNVSRYQMISYNFFASEDKNAIYGVSGAGQAFWYDGKILEFISTGVDLEKDMPRHVAPHENRLALGYKWGEVYLSGTDPLEYGASTALAASFGFGDKITGLMPAAGKALAVFTESSSNVLLGAPVAFGSLDGVEQQVVNHKVGAIEYTVQNIGNRPIFSSFRGIETFETMDEYSDFFTAPLTYNVSPWLLERLHAAAGVEATDKSVVNSVVVRNKNQYRLFFADGYVMTLTYVGPEKTPQCTTQKYWFHGDMAKYARIYATASGVTTDGRDRAFFSVEAHPNIPVPTQHALTDHEVDYVYELDRGRSFDGDIIKASFTLTHYFSKDEQGMPAPSHSKRFNAFHLHGTCAGSADLHMARVMNYEDLDDPELPYESVPFGGHPMKPEDEQKPKYTKGRLTGRGFAISVHVAHASAIEFPHTIQMISFLDDTQLRQDR